MKAYSDSEALAVFEALKIGGDYLWTNCQDDESVLRIEARRMDHTDNGECYVMARGTFFSKNHRDGTFNGMCVPAYSDEWTCVTELTPYEGPRPTYNSVHRYWYCESCDYKRPAPREGQVLSDCCGDDLRTSTRCMGIGHDDKCVCPDCEKK